MAETVFKVRAYSKAYWEELPFAPVDREVTLDRTRMRLKVGDGTTLWKDLPYVDVELINDLTTGGTTFALTAEMGKVLKNLVDQKADMTTVNELEQNLTTLINNKQVTVVDKLLSSNSRTDPLSAYQGYVLKQMIPDEVTVYNKLDSYSTSDALSANMGRELNSKVTSIETKTNNYSTETWTFTLESGGTVTKKVVLSS